MLFLFLGLFSFAQLPKDIVNQHCYDSGWPDMTEDMVETKDAIYILSDRITDDGNHNYDHDIVITKTNHAGELIWQKIFGGSSEDIPASIITDSLGMIYFGCMTYSSNGDIQSGNIGGLDIWIVKIDTSGQIIWEQTYGGSRDDYAAYLIYLENGNILAYGATFSSDHDVNINYGYLDIWIWEISPQGEIVNSRVFGSTQPDNIFSLIQTKDGGFFTAARAGANDGMVNGSPHGGNDIWLLKLDADLNIEWQKLLGGRKYDAGGRGVSELEDGGYIINGTTESSDGDVHGFDYPNPNPHGNGTTVPYIHDDIWVVRIDSLGNILWDIALGGDNFEQDSKIFANEDGTFTVFGSTRSPNNGDVEGKHYTYHYPHNINDDIWMVHLSENGELLDQRCFGNASPTALRRGVIKKTDSHYLIAGSAYARQAIPDEPELPTDGEVWGGYTSTSRDIWFFEIVDCENFQPETPANIEGEDSICIANTTESTYISQIANPQYEEAEWQMIPVEAGELTKQQDTAIIQWNINFEGQVKLSLRSRSSCGVSPSTDTLEIWLFQPLLNQAPAGPDTICLVNNQESYFTINNTIEPSLVSWQIEPETAGIITAQQDTAIITWSTSYEGEVELKTSLTNNCANVEYSPIKTVQLKTCLSVGGRSYRRLKVYPNPAKKYIIFELPQNSKESSLIISDIYGKSIAKLPLNKGQSKLYWNCRNVAPGVYFYQAEIGPHDGYREVYRGKVVINR